MQARGRRLDTTVAALVLVRVAHCPNALAQPAGLGAAMLVWTVEVSPNKPAVMRAQLTTTADLTRLIFDLIEWVTPKVTNVFKPDRVIVDLPEVEFRIDLASGQKGKGLVKAYRFGLFRSKQSRIV